MTTALRTILKALETDRGWLSDPLNRVMYWHLREALLGAPKQH